MLSESSDPAEPGVGEMRHKLLCNRAAAWLREDNPREALRDCKSAIEMDGDDPKAHHRGGVASLALDDYGEAIRMLAKSLSLGSKESDAKALLQLSELLARNEETLVELGQSAAGEEVLNALCSCCERLIGVDDDNDCDASESSPSTVALMWAPTLKAAVSTRRPATRISSRLIRPSKGTRICTPCTCT